jgi:3-oxo-5-alpha-steroid 4-dehydrogenase 3
MISLIGSVNLIKFLFVQLTFVIVVLGTLMNLIEDYLPTSVKQMFRYGKHAYKGKGSDKLVEKIEIPKAWFSHFYIFAILWSWVAFVFAVSVYFFDYQPHAIILSYLDISCGTNRSTQRSEFFHVKN